MRQPKQLSSIQRYVRVSTFFRILSRKCKKSISNSTYAICDFVQFKKYPGYVVMYVHVLLCILDMQICGGKKRW